MSAITFAEDHNWAPLDPADIRATGSAIEKDADAEGLFWEVRVEDRLDGDEPQTVFNHYLRVKIYTEHGRESQTKVEIPYFRGTDIGNIAARTINPNGSIVELKKDSIFDRDLAKAGKIKLRAKTFAFPAVEPGAIVEYRWRETRHMQLADYLRLQLQRNIPIRRVKYIIKPYMSSQFGYAMQAMSFHIQHPPFEKEPNGFMSVTIQNLPAFREEPRMPPEDQVRAWLLLYYTKNPNQTTEEFWLKYGKEAYGKFRDQVKVNGDIKKAITSIVGNAATDEQKLEQIYRFCQDNIKNINDDASGLTPDDRKKLKENHSPADTLKRSMGTGYDINKLFAALAIAAGLDARLAHLSNRDDIFFDPTFPDDYFLPSRSVAVKLGGQWRFFDPATNYAPFGMLRWQEEGSPALIPDPKEKVFVVPPIASPNKSLEKRTATLRLSEDGSLEGDVHVEYSGHLAMMHKEYNDEDSPNQREETLKDLVKEAMSNAELSDIKVENVTDHSNPFVYSYHIKAPGYAVRTGKRLFLQIGFFQHNRDPLFPATNRRYPVYFHFPWSEEDNVAIELPPNFSLDGTESPMSLPAGVVSKYDAQLTFSPDGRCLKYRRTFFFGGGSAILFSLDKYSNLKQYFDLVHKADSRTVTLKQF